MRQSNSAAPGCTVSKVGPPGVALFFALLACTSFSAQVPAAGDLRTDTQQDSIFAEFNGLRTGDVVTLVSGTGEVIFQEVLRRDHQQYRRWIRYPSENKEMRIVVSGSKKNEIQISRER